MTISIRVKTTQRRQLVDCYELFRRQYTHARRSAGLYARVSDDALRAESSCNSLAEVTRHYVTQSTSAVAESRAGRGITYISHTCPSGIMYYCTGCLAGVIRTVTWSCYTVYHTRPPARQLQKIISYSVQ